MKKLALILALVMGIAISIEAQPRAIGLRLGYGGSASYQHSFGEKNMLQADLDLIGFWGCGVAATYNWIFPISNNSWNWYAGVGGATGYYWGWNGSSSGYIGVAGMIGIEYNFAFPLQLSVDWRPVLGPAFGRGYAGFNGAGLYAGSIGIGARYRF